MDLEKIKRLQAQAQAAKKGSSVHRKPVRAAAAGSGDDKKLSAALKKLAVQPIAGVEEVNMFQEDGSVLHFSAPKGASADRWSCVDEGTDDIALDVATSNDGRSRLRTLR